MSYQASRQARPSSQGNQMRYVPKSSTHQPSLTTSLRAASSGGSSSSSRPEGSLIDENFVNYLPQDEAVASGLGPESGGLDTMESQSVVDLLNEELKTLLMMKPRDFWKEVSKNSSLHSFLDSYLKFRHRWYDLPHHGPKQTISGVVVGDMDLCRRVFMILFRISSNKDPGSTSSDSLSMKDHTTLLQEKKLLDLPKLLDICAIYAHENQDLTSLLVINAIKAQKISNADISNVASQFLSIVHTMCERKITSLHDFSEVLDFINDSVVTLNAFVEAYIPASLSFCSSFEMSYGVDELLITLARLHDSLLPSLLSSSHSTGDLQSSVKLLSKRIAKFGWVLLDHCYLNASLHESELREIAIMIPAKVEDPLIRGEIILQKLKEINGESSYVVNENIRSRSFLQSLERDFDLLTRVNTLFSTGWIYLEQSQLQFLSQLTGSSLNLSSNPNSNSNFSSQINASKKEIGLIYEEKDEEIIMLESKISQIRDLFPDYGKGFLATCLEIYDHNPEKVIQHILEGTLHKDLISLDTTLEEIPPRNPKPNTTIKDKGKAILVPEPVPKQDKGKGKMVINQSSSSSSSTFINNSSPLPARLPVQGRFTRKNNEIAPDSKTLDSIIEKSEIRSSILATQYENEKEYEDEYDDSFDELGLSVVESSYEESESTETGTTGTAGPRWSTQKKPQFYVKDGKNYSYKVSGGLAVNSSKEAALVNQVQRDMIHGLGRGGNLPNGAVNRGEREGGEREGAGAGEGEGEEGSLGDGGRGGRGGRGWGRGRGGRHHQKDRAARKQLAGMGGRF